MSASCDLLKIRVKKLIPEAEIPKYAHRGDAGMDVVATSISVTNDYIEYGTGLAFEVPKGYVMLIFPRSSNSKKDLLLCNSVGVLDSTYRGELKFRYKRVYRIKNQASEETNGEMTTNSIVNPGMANEMEFDASKWYWVGDKVGQIMILPYPEVHFIETDELSETERGEGGFGSTGK